jgi:hypothetical protein
VSWLVDAASAEIGLLNPKTAHAVKEMNKSNDIKASFNDLFFITSSFVNEN